MKKTIRLMILFLGISGVNGGPSPKERFNNTRKAIFDAKRAKKRDKIKSLLNSSKDALVRNKEDIANLVKKAATAVI